jgi:hypothetical protein
MNLKDLQLVTDLAERIARIDHLQAEHWPSVSLDISSEHGSVTGWLVFGGSIGLGILLIIYAILKERR